METSDKSVDWTVEDETQRYIFDVNPRARDFHLVSPVFGDIHTLLFITQMILIGIRDKSPDPFDRETARLQLEAMTKVCKQRFMLKHGEHNDRL